MTTPADVSITRAAAAKQAEALRAQAEALRTRVATIKEYRLERVGERWSDAVAKKYLRQMRLNVENLEGCATDLENIAKGIVDAANALT